MIPALYEWLTADSAVTALVSDRVYRHSRAPDDVVKPYITWSVVGGHAENYLAERATFDQELVQIDCWSLTAAQCKTLMLSVVAVVESHGYLSGLPEDDYEDDTKLFRYMIQAYFWTTR